MTGASDRKTIACVVEGHGEVTAIPKLLYRIARERGIFGFDVPTPMRINRGRILAPDGLEKAVRAMALRVSPAAGGVLILIDADDDCPASLGPALLARAKHARSDIRVSVVLAKREFEAWFLAAAPSLAGYCGLAPVAPPPDPEEIRGAKEWLSAQRTDGHPYRPAIDQAPLASRIDIKMARTASESFDKFCREVELLLGVQGST